MLWHQRAGVALVAALLILGVARPANAQSTREKNEIVMDVDFTQEAAAGGSDMAELVGTLQLILDRIAAQTAPPNVFHQSRTILWVAVTDDKECRHPTDAGILEIRRARFIDHNHQWIVFGHQSSEAQLAFRLTDCDGRELFRFPYDKSAYASAAFSPYYVSVGGTAAAVALSTAHANNYSLAATIGIVNAYSPLQTNIGQHDPNEMRRTATYRLFGNIPGPDAKPPARGTVAAALERCRFYGASGRIGLTCTGPPRPQPRAEATRR